MANRPAQSDPEPARDDSGELNYEEAVARLEGLIERIEGGEIGLEESIAAYEQGMGLVKRCRAVLDRAEQRIDELTAGELEGEPEPSAGDADSEAPF